MKTTTTMTIGCAAALLLAACGDEPPATQNAATETVTVTGTAEAAATVTVTEEAGAGATVTVTETAEAGAPETVTETVTAVAAEDAEPEEEEPEADPEPEADSGEIAFGETWTWDDGVSVTVSEPEAYTPGEYSFGGEGYDEHVLFTVTVANESGAGIDLNLFTVSVQSGRTEGEQIFDSENGVDGSPMTTLLDGRDVEFIVAFGIEDPDDIVMQLAPTFDHDDAYFVG